MAFRVMIVDDAGFIRQILGRVLETLDCTVVAEAKTGVEAVKKARKHKPDAIFMDIILPEKNGATAATEILELFPGLPIIAMSTADDPVVREKAMAAGCVAFLEKPFNRESVKRVLSDLDVQEARLSHG